jgi:hypothetical protein
VTPGGTGYCGIDQGLREVAGHITLWEERLSDTASHRRRKACLPGVKALLERMMGAAAGPWIHSPLRFGVIEGSTVQGPGAKGHRRQLKPQLLICY